MSPGPAAAEPQNPQDSLEPAGLRLQSAAVLTVHFALSVEVTVHDLNHRPRRCLNGRTACAVFNDDAFRRRWSKTQRQVIFRLLLAPFGAMIGNQTNGAHLHPPRLGGSRWKPGSAARV